MALSHCRAKEIVPDGICCEKACIIRPKPGRAGVIECGVVWTFALPRPLSFNLAPAPSLSKRPHLSRVQGSCVKFMHGGA
jgi:hypothetical protein